MENLLVIPKDKKQLNLLKEMFNEMNVKYKSEKPEGLYHSDLNKEIKKSREEKEKGQLIEIDPNDVWKSLGLV